ncbi:uncharacterized protein LOC133336153 [Musca vetustissima]|uniref:uncharacterized protein LOC133336153 n=1 Tax=Musca vetustissima TaxID=27455 RepID=UPI002AB5E345|nr:uncharacterized protein LOC133336153 [Musca vetustissima]
MVVDFHSVPENYDHAEDNPRHLVHIDGTEMRIVHTFCELYNCSVQVDTSEKSEWGMVYPNYTADGLLGLIVEGKTHMAMGAFFQWYIAYRSIEQTTFLGRSGITCLVPAPTRVTTWALPISPFTYTLWLAVAVCLFVEALALFLARLFEEREIMQLEDGTIWSSIEFGYTTTLKLFISQGSDYVVDSHTVRMVLFACYMIDIIVTSIYAGGLSAILTLPDLEEAADSVERMYSHNLTWTATSYDWVASIADEETGVVDPLMQGLVNNYIISSREEMRRKAQTDNIGFALERMAFGHFGNGHFITPESLDRLKLMVDDIYYVFTVAMVPRMWAHLPKYNDLILAWHSSGFSKYWEWKIVADYMNANEQNQVQASMFTQLDVGPVKLDMNNFAGLIVPWIIAEKSEWGMVYPNYTADGLLGLIVEGKTHMGMGAFFQWYIAYRSIEQTTFLGRSGVTCLVPVPTRVTTWALPISPFTYTLWLAVAFCLFLEALALFLARLFEERQIMQLEDETIWSSIEFGYTTTLKLFISQGSDYVVDSHTVRMVLFACYMIDIIVTSIYAGGLSAILTLPDLEEAADSVERMYSHNLTWTATSYDWVASIADEETGVVDPLMQRLVNNYIISSREEMRRKAQTENIGFAVERMTFGHFGNGHFITPESLDRLKLMVDDMFYVFTVAMVPRMWAHLPKYNDLILAWHSSGFSKYWEWKILADYMNANEQNQVQASMFTQLDVGPVKLDMNNFAGLIVPWIIGIIISIMAFIGEWIYYWWCKKD